MQSILRLTSYARPCTPYLINHVSVRWKRRVRKPFWLGVARSKMFVIRKPKAALPENEAVELARISEMYQRNISSLQNVIMASVEENSASSAEIEATVQKAIEESLTLNEQWNAESARLREESWKLREAQHVSILNKIDLFKKKDEEHARRIEEIVQREIDQSSTFITEETLDDAIEKCLSSVQDYNYAIDLEGNVYLGQDMKPLGKLSDPSVQKKLELLH